MNVSDNKTNPYEQEQVILKICSFLRMAKPKLTETELIDQIKEICVMRVCQAIGVRNMYNSKNRFFCFLSVVMGQALSDMLHLSLHIAPDNLRLIRYNGINFVNKLKEFMQKGDMDEAMIDAFNLIDDNKDIVEKLIRC